MTDEELKALVAENSRAIRELRASIAEQRTEEAEANRELRASIAELRAEGAESRREFGEQRAAEAEANRELQASLARLSQEADLRWQKFQEEVRASRQEMDRALTSMSRTVETVSREIGRFHNKFGDYTEALCRPSLMRTLRERFHMTEFRPNALGFRNGDAVEVDMLAHANNGRDEVYVAEVKTHLRQDGIDQILHHLRVFPEFFPAHRGKKLYGILAAVEAPPNIRQQVLKQGLYLMLVAGDVLEMRVPEGFVPRVFPTA